MVIFSKIHKQCYQKYFMNNVRTIKTKIIEYTWLDILT